MSDYVDNRHNRGTAIVASALDRHDAEAAQTAGEMREHLERAFLAAAGLEVVVR